MCRECINTADLLAGKRLRTIRKSRGFSQMMLAEALGVSFQQVQKYERGLNRISIGKIYLLAKFFNVPELYFFDVPKDEYEMINNYKKCAPARKNILFELSETYSQEEGEEEG